MKNIAIIVITALTTLALVGASRLLADNRAYLPSVERASNQSPLQGPCPPQPTYTPYPTYTALPTRRPTETRTPTPEPGLFPKDSPYCIDLFDNEGFEGDVSGWQDLKGNPPRIVGETFGLKPAEGKRMLALGLEKTVDERLRGPSVAGSYPGILTATLRFSLVYTTTEVLGSEHLHMGLTGWGAYFDWFLSGPPMRWKALEFDMLPVFKKQFPALNISFVAPNDASFPTVWFVDALSLEVCGVNRPTRITPVPPTPTISPTPVPTGTPTWLPGVIPTPGDGCSEVIRNGGFENVRESWGPIPTPGSFRKVAKAVRATNNVTPAEGQFMAEFLDPADGSSYVIYDSPVFTVPKSVKRATMRFSVTRRSSEPLPNKDRLTVYVYAENGPALGVGLVRLDPTQLDDDWRTVGLETIEAFTEAEIKGWDRLYVEFRASGDQAQPTNWYVDAVSLETCTGSVLTPTPRP